MHAWLEQCNVLKTELFKESQSAHALLIYTHKLNSVTQPISLTEVSYLIFTLKEQKWNDNSFVKDEITLISCVGGMEDTMYN